MSTRKTALHRAQRYVCILAFPFFCVATSHTAAGAVPVILPSAPTLPTIGSNVFNVTVSNPHINGGATA